MDSSHPRIQWLLWALPQWYENRDQNVTIYLHIEPRLKISLSHRAFVASTGTILLYTFVFVRSVDLREAYISGLLL
jgi:hypothetical protein